jgi:hypothetical protein
MSREESGYRELEGIFPVLCCAVYGLATCDDCCGAGDHPQERHHVGMAQRRQHARLLQQQGRQKQAEAWQAGAGRAGNQLGGLRLTASGQHLICLPAAYCRGTEGNSAVPVCPCAPPQKACLVQPGEHGVGQRQRVPAVHV